MVVSNLLFTFLQLQIYITLSAPNADLALILPTKNPRSEFFFLKNLKILEASSYVQINMTKFRLEHDRKFLQRRTNLLVSYLFILFQRK